MGTRSSKQNDSPDEEENQLKYDEEEIKGKYENILLKFCNIFEENINILSDIQLEYFLNLLNNYKVKKKESIEAPETKEFNLLSKSKSNDSEKNFKLRHTVKSTKTNFSIKDYLTSSKSIINKKHTFIRNSEDSISANNTIFTKFLVEEDFKIFFKNKVFKNPLFENNNHIIKISNGSEIKYEYRLNIFDSFLKECFWSYQKFLFTNRDKYISNNFLEVPIYIIFSLAFNLCNNDINKKIILLTNILSNNNGFINNNPHTEGFIYCYFKNCIYSPINFVLLEIEKNDLINKQDLVEMFFEEDKVFKCFEKSFYFKNSKSIYRSLIYVKEFKDNRKEKIEIDFLNVFDLFVKDVLKLIFGSAGKKELLKEEFINFLNLKEEGGGYWFLFNAGIRNKFESFLENQIQ